LSVNLRAGNGGSFEGVINNCKIHDNENNYLWGTAIAIQSWALNSLLTPTISNCEIFNNRGQGAFGAVVVASYNAGGVTNNPAFLEPVFADCRFYNNQATLIGGGALAVLHNANTTINACRFYNNQVLNGASVNGGGGALYFSNYDQVGQTNTLNNCLIVNNTASHRGGGIMCDVDGIINTQINNSTIADNSASQGGQIYTRVNGNNVISANNSIFYGGSASPWGHSFYLRGSSLTVANQINLNTCLIDAATCSTTPQIFAFGANTGVNCSGAMQYNVNPQFVNAATNNYTLNTTSPAINAGNNTLVPASMNTDIAGNPRIHNPSGAVVDLGCYENFPSMQQRPMASVTNVKKVRFLGYNNPKQKLTAQLNFGNQPYTYLWSTGDTSKSICPRPDETTTYSVTITDADGNTYNSSQNISVIDVQCQMANGKKGIQYCVDGTTNCAKKGKVKKLVFKGKASLGECLPITLQPDVSNIEPVVHPPHPSRWERFKIWVLGIWIAFTGIFS